MCERDFCDYENYFQDQAGGRLDIAYFRSPYQRGYGPFSALFKRYAIPVMKYLFKRGLNFGQNVYSDVKQGTKLKTAMKSNLKRTGGETLSDIGEKLSQSGSGLRMKPKLNKVRRKRRRLSKPRKTKRRRTKTKTKRRVRRKRRTIQSDIFG